LVLAVGAFSGFLAVVLGAMGAHAVKAWLTPETMAVYQTAVQYHFIHTLALVAVGLCLERFVGNRYLMFSAVSFLMGMVLFSGCLYLYTLTGLKFMAMLAPVGGLLLMAGWCLFGVAMMALYRKPETGERG
jgi:uncharacterized membrane protein YgdD (TMEM256/DUF423 family)